MPLSEVITLEQSVNETSIHHKDLLPVVYVSADMAAELDSPLYGMFEVMPQVRVCHKIFSRSSRVEIGPGFAAGIAGHHWR